MRRAFKDMTDDDFISFILISLLVKFRPSFVPVPACLNCCRGRRVCTLQSVRTDEFFNTRAPSSNKWAHGYVLDVPVVDALLHELWT
jgi:hypothetical protein